MKPLFVFSFVVALAAAACSSASPSTASPGGGGTDVPDADDGEQGEVDASSDAAPERSSSSSGSSGSSSGGCVPDCKARTCGKDPTCGTSCGTCGASTVCNATANAASCVAPTIVWEVDGAIVAQLGSDESYYTVSQDTIGLWFPFYGRNVSIGIGKDRKTGNVLGCAAPYDPNVTLTLFSGDNTYAGLQALPLAWKNLVFSTCGAQSSGDTVTTRSLTITQVSPTRVVGSYEVVVKGAGPRAGSTLRVHGAFDVKPKAM